jgi:hypothetical protein
LDWGDIWVKSRSRFVIEDPHGSFVIEDPRRFLIEDPQDSSVIEVPQELSGFQQCQLSKCTVSPANSEKKKKTLLRGFSIPNPNFSEFAFLVDIFEKVRIVDFNPSSNLL